MIPKVAGVFLCLVMGVMQFLLHCFILPRSALGQHSILNWVICKVVSEVKKSDPNSVPRLDDFFTNRETFQHLCNYFWKH